MQPTFLTTAGTNYLVIKRVGNAALITSDQRLKQNIASFTGGLEEVLGINTVTFEYNGQAAGAQNDGKTHVGIIAQDMQKNGLGKYTIKE